MCRIEYKDQQFLQHCWATLDQRGVVSQISETNGIFLNASSLDDQASFAKLMDVYS